MSMGITRDPFPVLTSSGFPSAVAVAVHNFFKNSSVNLLAGKFDSKSMKGMFTSVFAQLR